MILGTELIKKRLRNGEIFQKESCLETSIKEASYALRISRNGGMVIDREPFEPGKCYPKPFIEIKAGRIAVLSTEEKFCMPRDLVGRLSVRLDFAIKGITTLMSGQVDPFYGSDEPQRLYIKVANYGINTVKINFNDLVFSIEFSTVRGANKPTSPRINTWTRVVNNIENLDSFDLTYTSNVDNYANAIEQKTGQQIDGGINRIRDSQQSVVLFGVFLVAITILTVAVAAILKVEGAPSWLPNGGWIWLLVLCSVATLGLLVFMGIAGWGYWMSTKRYYTNPLGANAQSGSTPIDTTGTDRNRMT